MADTHSIVMPELNNSRVCAIYRIRILDDFYIGSSSNVRDRWRCHLKELLAGKHHSRFMQNRFNKYTTSAVEFSILEFVPLADDLLKREQHYLDALRPQYNTSPTAGSPRGIKRSPEYRARQSATRKGKRYVSDEAYARAALKRRGLKRSDEAKRKARESFAKAIEARRNSGFVSKLRGRQKSPEHIAKMSAAMRGKQRPKRSLETRMKQSLALRGKKRTPETLARMSAAMTGVKRGPLSAEHRAKISAANTGRVFSPEWCAKISASKRKSAQPQQQG